LTTIRASGGTTYYFQVAIPVYAYGSVVFNLTRLDPPALGNDDFADAVAVGALPYGSKEDTTGATGESDEPSPCGSNAHSVWYSFTPSADGVLRADTIGSEHLTLLTVYRGASLASLERIACETYGAVVFSAAAGNTYYFQVGVDDSYLVGDIVFNLRVVEPPAKANDDFADAFVISQLPFSNAENIAGASAEQDEPGCSYNARTVWYAFTPTADVHLRVDALGTTGTSADIAVYAGSSLGSLTLIDCGSFSPWDDNAIRFRAYAATTYYFQVGVSPYGFGEVVLNLSEVPRPTKNNDAFADAAIVQALPYVNHTPIEGATREAEEPNGPQPCGINNTVWYSFTAPTDVVLRADTAGSDLATGLAVYTGDSIGSLVGIACEMYAQDDRNYFRAQAGNTYYFQVGGHAFDFGQLVFNLRAVDPPAKGNDDSADALAIPGLPYTNTQNIEGALSEPGEFDCAGTTHTVWYSFTPSTDAVLKADTVGSDFYTVFSVFRGTDLASLDRVRTCNFGSYAAAFFASAHTTYYIQVGGYYGEFGNLVFNLETVDPPTNNDFADAVPILGLPYTRKVETLAADLEAGEPQTCWSIGRTAWFSFTPGEDVALRATSYSADDFFFSAVAVHTGPSMDSLAEVECEFYGYFPRELVFTATGGTTYYFQVGGALGSGGSQQFYLEEVPGASTPTPAGTATPTATATATPTITSTPTQQPSPGDTDGDGCSDAVEAGTDPALGGQRNYVSFWDFYDVWTPEGASWVRDRVVTVNGDIFQVARRFGANDASGTAPINRNSDPLAGPPPAAPGYHAAFDRGPLIGPNPWDLGPPDGFISVGVDILGVARQFGHSCL
jgi:hypothetical protein